MAQQAFADHAAVRRRLVQMVRTNDNLLMRIFHNFVDAAKFSEEDKQYLHESDIGEIMAEDKQMMDLLAIALSDNPTTITKHHEDLIAFLRKEILLEEEEEVPMSIILPDHDGPIPLSDYISNGGQLLFG